MSYCDGNPRWYALSVKSRREEIVSRDLRLRGMEEYLPLYRARRAWSDRVQSVELPLFPGYVFCRFEYAQRFQAVTTPGVVSVIGFGGSDAPVEQSEIAAVQAILASGLPVEPWPYLRAGDQVRIDKGILAGLHGTLLREKGAWRVVVNVELLLRSVAIEVDRGIISPADGSVRTLQPGEVARVAGSVS